MTGGRCEVEARRAQRSRNHMKVPAVPGLEKPRKNEPYEVWPYRPWPHRDFSKTKSRDFFLKEKQIRS